MRTIEFANAYEFENYMHKKTRTLKEKNEQEVVWIDVLKWIFIIIGGIIAFPLVIAWLFGDRK